MTTTLKENSKLLKWITEVTESDNVFAAPAGADNSKLDYQNLFNDYCSISGINVNDIKRDFEHGFVTGWFEYFRDTPCRYLDPIERSEVTWLIKVMSNFTSVGDFLDDDTPKEAMAAYALVALDRLVMAAAKREDGWLALGHLHELHELMQYLEIDKTSLSKNARKAALARHAENHAQREDAIEFYCKHKNEYKSRIAIARKIASDIIPGTTERTVDNWLKEYERSMQSACTL